MEIPLNGKVYIGGELAGEVTAVIVDPYADAVTQLVVKESDLFGAEVVTPVGWLAESNHQMVSLSCSRQQLSQCEQFIETEIIPGIPITGYAPLSPMDMPFVTHKHIPQGQWSIARGSQVRAHDGAVGKVDEFEVRPGGWQITDILIREGPFWDHKEVRIPVSYIDHLAENMIYLRADRKSIEELPQVHIG